MDASPELESWFCITKCLSGKMMALKTPVFGAEFLMWTSVQKQNKKTGVFGQKKNPGISWVYLGRGHRPLNLSSST